MFKVYRHYGLYFNPECHSFSCNSTKLIASPCSKGEHSNFVYVKQTKKNNTQDFLHQTNRTMGCFPSMFSIPAHLSIIDLKGHAYKTFF